MRPATRLAELRPSPIRQLSEGAPADAMPLGLGEPTWDLPEVARRALAEVQGICAYGPNMGLPELRRALGAWFGVEAESVLVTVGSEEALLALFMAYLDPGSTVLVPDPGYPAYPALASLAGAEPRPYALEVDTLLSELDTPGVRILLLNTPSNPTGFTWSEPDLRRIVAAAEARGILVASDEVYRELYLEARPPSLLDVTSKGIVLGSVSKAWGAPGLRVGWALGEPELLAPLRLVHGYAVTAAPLPSQRAALALVEASDQVLHQARQELRTRWEALAEGLAALGQPPRIPGGAFYHWMPLPPWALADPLQACLRIRDEGKVVVVPGFAFGSRGQGHLRISYAAKPEQIREGMGRLRPFWEPCP